MTAHVVDFPQHRRLEVDRQRERRGVWHRLLDGLPPSDQKELVVDGAVHGFLNERDAEVLIAELGLEEA